MNFSLPGVGPDKPPQGRTVAYNGCVLNIVMDTRRPSSHTYIISLIDGSWPSDDDLITLADRGIPPNAHHFGGRVSSWSDGRKFVVVYTD